MAVKFPIRKEFDAYAFKATPCCTDCAQAPEIVRTRINTMQVAGAIAFVKLKVWLVCPIRRPLKAAGSTAVRTKIGRQALIRRVGLGLLIRAEDIYKPDGDAS